MHTPLRRRFEYFLYQAGIRRTIHRFTKQAVPSQITFVITDSLGDIAINSSVTRYLRSRFPNSRMSLVTHPKYLAAAAFNPDYDSALAYGSDICDLRPGAQSYQDEIRIARSLTPDMDLLFLCQPSAWCDELSGRHTMLELQNRLCGVSEEVRLQPRLTVPTDAVEWAKATRRAQAGRAVFMSRQTFTFGLGTRQDDYYRTVASWCLDHDVRVYDNSTSPIISHELCVPVGDAPLADAVALATLSDAAVMVRSGFVDLVGFSRPELPQYILYPEGNYPFSTLSWLSWCSVAEMGVTGAVEVVSPFSAKADTEYEAEKTIKWLSSTLDVKDKKAADA